MDGTLLASSSHNDYLLEQIFNRFLIVDQTKNVDHCKGEFLPRIWFQLNFSKDMFYGVQAPIKVFPHFPERPLKGSEQIFSPQKKVGGLDETSSPCIHGPESPRNACSMAGGKWLKANSWHEKSDHWERVDFFLSRKKSCSLSHLQHLCFKC